MSNLTEIHLRYYLGDINGINKAIWTQVGNLGKSLKRKGLKYQITSYAGAGKRKGQGLLGQRERKKRQVGQGQLEDLQIIL